MGIEQLIAERLPFGMSSCLGRAVGTWGPRRAHAGHMSFVSPTALQGMGLFGKSAAWIHHSPLEGPTLLLDDSRESDRFG